MSSRIARAATPSADSIALRPLGSGQDDWPRLIEIAQAVAYQSPIQLLPGLNGEPWLCKSEQVLPNGTVIYGTPATVIVQTLPVDGTQSAVAFHGVAVQDPSVKNPVTSLTADTVVGSTQVSVAGIVPVGSYIQILNFAMANRGCMHRVVAASGGTLTLDRPIRYAIAASNSVVRIVIPTQDIRILGEGMRMTGTGQRYVEIQSATRCVIQDIVVDASQGGVVDLAMSYDICSFDCTFENIQIDGGGTALSGLNIESGDQCTIVRCSVRNSVTNGIGIMLLDSVDCTVDTCSATACDYGLYLGADGDLLGCDSCQIWNSDFSGNRQAGVVVACGSDGNLLQGVSANNNTQQGIVVGDMGYSACVGNMLASCKATGNGNLGLLIWPGATSTSVRDTDLSNNVNLGLATFGPVQLSNVTVNTSGTGQGALGFFAASTPYSVSVQGANINYNPTSAVNIVFIGTGISATLYACNISTSNASTGIAIAGQSTVFLQSSTIASAKGAGVYVETGGTLRVGGAVDLDKCARTLTLEANSYVSFGTVALNGGAGVMVAWPHLKSTDQIVLTRTATGGTPGGLPVVTCTAGVGFTFVGDVGDFSTYQWAIVPTSAV